MLFRSGADPDGTINKVFDLFTELTDNEELIDFPIIYASSLHKFAKKELTDESKDIIPLLDCILENIKPPVGDDEATLQFQATTLDYNDYVGRIAIGRIINGKMTSGENVTLIKTDGSYEKGKIVKLFEFKDLGRVETQAAESGDIVGVAGFSDIQIGETLSAVVNQIGRAHV